MKTLATTRRIPALLLCLLVPACGQTDVSVTFPPRALVTPVAIRTIRGMRPVVKVRMDDRLDLWLLVDTGASVTVLPAELFGGTEGMQEVEKLCYGNGLCFHNPRVLAAVSGFAQVGSGTYNGILGVDLLARFPLTLDYRGRRLYCSDRRADSDGDTRAVPFHREADTGRPRAAVSTGDETYASILLDTGSAFTRLTPEMLDALPDAPEPTYGGISHHFGDQESVVHLTYAGYCVEEACPGEIPLEVGGWPATGGTFFREYLTIFRFDEGTLYLSPYEGREHILADPVLRTGLQVDIFDAARVVFVQAGSPAQEADIRPGERILSINGVSVDRLGYFGVYGTFEDPSVSEFSLQVESTSGQIRQRLLACGDVS